MGIYCRSINCVIGDLENNISRIIQECELIKSSNTEDKQINILFPELSLCGYPLQDLIYFENLYQIANDGIKLLLDKIKEHELENLHIFVGNIAHYTLSSQNLTENKNQIYQHPKYINAYYELYNNKIVRQYAKRDLPNYGVFDEQRHFVSGSDIGFDYITNDANHDISVAICEDIWNGVELNILSDSKYIIVPNASPYEISKPLRRLECIKNLFERYHKTIYYFNAIGAQDELVFDDFLIIYSSHNDYQKYYSHFKAQNCISERVYKQLVSGLKDYVNKNGFKSVALGLSGGIDSALCAAIAFEALGSENVIAILMPSQYSSDHSISDAIELAKNLNIKTYTFPIESIYNNFRSNFQNVFNEELSDIADQNIQARIRGQILMSLSNQNSQIGNHLILATGNKSELAVGYSTIYGDAVGGFAPIKDLYKTEVYQLANYINSISPIIPNNTIAKPPSAELKPGQKDTDSLPDYQILDYLISKIIGDDLMDEHIVDIDKTTMDELIHKVKKMIKNSQWKRDQYPLGTKVHHRAFGKDWRMPISSVW